MTQPTDALVSEPPVASIIAETTEIRKCIIIVPADGKFYVPDGSTKDCRILIGYTMEDAILVLMGKQPATTDYTEGRAYAGAQCYAVTQPQQRNVTLNTLANELREEAASDEHGHGPWFREIADTIDRLTRELREAREAEKRLSDELDMREQEECGVDDEIRKASERAEQAEAERDKARAELAEKDGWVRVPIEVENACMNWLANRIQGNVHGEDIELGRLMRGLQIYIKAVADGTNK